MATQSHKEELHISKFEAPQSMKTVALAFTGIGLIGFLVGIIKNPEAMWPNYLTAFFFVSCLALGGMFFTVIQHVAKAGWSAGIRRLSEGMTSFLPIMVVGSLVLIAGIKYLYSWSDAAVIAESSMVAAKTAYLNVPFLVVRMLIFGIGALLFARKIIGNSLKQDKDGAEVYTNQNVGFSIGYILFFAIFFSLFSMDLLMSLLPTWYSTIFGIYCFSGMFQSSLAFLILIMLYMRNTGQIKGYFGMDHVHDVGKFLKGFTVFWAYIAFSQFMLIWYANIPEETEFYLMRSHGGWMTVSMALLIFKFIVPFLALLPRDAKRNTVHLSLVCVLVLVMQYLDIYWLVLPNFEGIRAVTGFYEITLLMGFLGLFLLTMIQFFSKNNIVAIKDPRMHESLNHHVTY